jgi:hypothetical protein
MVDAYSRMEGKVMDVYTFITSNGHIFWSENSNPGGSSSNEWRKDKISATALDRGASVKPGKIAGLPLGNYGENTQCPLK